MDSKGTKPKKDSAVIDSFVKEYHEEKRLEEVNAYGKDHSYRSCGIVV